jgi:hypothetical protein
MLSPSRAAVVVLSATLALAVAGCGSDDKKPEKTATVAAVPPAGQGLSTAQYAKLNAAAAKVVEDLGAIGKSTTECAKGATSGKAVSSCVAGRLTTADDELKQLAGVLRDAASGIGGACGTDLKAFAGDVETLGTTFKTAATAFTSGDTAKAGATLKGLDLSKVQTTGTAAQTSCKP